MSVGSRDPEEDEDLPLSMLSRAVTAKGRLGRASPLPRGEGTV